MFLKVFPLVKAVNPNVGKLQRITQSVFIANHISKRNAGHSESANRKSAKEATAQKKSIAVARIRALIKKAILKEQNANPAVNPSLQAAMREAQKSNIPQAQVEKLIKPFAALLNRDVIHSFPFSHSLGIKCVVDISSIHRIEAKSQAMNIMRKFGFNYDNENEVTHTEIGIIYGKQSENVENAYDKAIEDAIAANCEEVVQNDDGNFNFFCTPQCLKSCTKSLSELGYKIEYSEKEYRFPTYINVDDIVSARLEQLEEKLGIIPGFVKITVNIK